MRLSCNPARRQFLFLCDQNGTVLQSHMEGSNHKQTPQEYVDGLLDGIEDGSLAPYDASVTGPDGRLCGVYYYQMSNGWTTVLTIPFQTVLRELTTIYHLFLVLSGLFLLAAVLLSVRDFRLNRRMWRTHDTVQALGNLYYALYRVNYKTGHL